MDLDDLARTKTRLIAEAFSNILNKVPVSGDLGSWPGDERFSRWGGEDGAANSGLAGLSGKTGLDGIGRRRMVDGLVMGVTRDDECHG